MSFFSIFKTKTPISTAPYSSNGITFRVVFMSPFFELEVNGSGNGWNSVHSQEGETDESHVTSYPLLRFTSFGDAVDYATKRLGLVNMDKGLRLGFFNSPPASYMKGTASAVHGSNSIKASASSVKKKDENIKIYNSKSSLIISE